MNTIRKTIRSVIGTAQQNRDYCGSVVTGYILMGMNIAVQMLLVPIYLKSLGKYQFGVLMIILSFINYAAIGIGWMSGGILRVMGEQSACKDDESYVQTYALSKWVNVSYAAVLAGVMMTIGLGADQLLFPDAGDELRLMLQRSIVAASIYIVALYDFSVDRMALAALGKQTVGNILQLLGLVVFALSVIPLLKMGGGLDGVLGCLTAGVLAGRVVSWVYWRHIGLDARWRWPGAAARPLLRRLIGPMGIGYLLYGIIMLTMLADAMLVGWLGGAAMAAEFILVWKVAEVLLQLIWRLPEYYQPYLIQMDAQGQQERLRDRYQAGLRWMSLISLITGTGYALLGSQLVKLWVGDEYSVDNVWGFVLAGAAIFWLGSARLPAVFAYATLQLRRLNLVAGVELLGKLVLSFLLFQKIGYLAPLAAINVMHAGGIFLLYRRMVK